MFHLENSHLRTAILPKHISASQVTSHHLVLHLEMFQSNGVQKSGGERIRSGYIGTDMPKNKLIVSLHFNNGGDVPNLFCVIMLRHVYTQELAQLFETVKKKKFGGKKRSLKEEMIFTKLHTTGHPCIRGPWLHLRGNLGVISDQWPDPLSRTTPSTSSNKSRSLGTPMADPCCWGQLQEIGLSGPTPTWPGSVKTRRRSTWFKLLPKTCWQG